MCLKPSDSASPPHQIKINTATSRSTANSNGCSSAAERSEMCRQSWRFRMRHQTCISDSQGLDAFRMRFETTLKRVDLESYLQIWIESAHKTASTHCCIASSCSRKVQVEVHVVLGCTGSLELRGHQGYELQAPPVVHSEGGRLHWGIQRPLGDVHFCVM